MHLENQLTGRLQCSMISIHNLIFAASSLELLIIQSKGSVSYYRGISRNRQSWPLRNR